MNQANELEKEIIHMEDVKSKSGKIVFFPAFRSFLVAVLLISMFVGCASNSRVGGGAKTGAAVGAGIGLLLGVLTGDAEVAVAGAAVGAAAGAGQGAYEGWKQEQDDERTRQITEAIRESKQSGGQQPGGDEEAWAREELTRFLGVWVVEGWVQEPGDERLSVQAQVNGNIEMNHFVELAYIDLKVTGVDTQVWGTSTLGYDKANGYSISTRFNTLPEPLRSTGGTFDRSSRSFTFTGPDYRLIIRFNTPDRFMIETYLTTGGSETKIESYTFTRT